MKKIHTKSKKANRPFAGVAPVRLYNVHTKMVPDGKGGMIPILDTPNSKRIIPTYKNMKKYKS